MSGDSLHVTPLGPCQVCGRAAHDGYCEEFIESPETVPRSALIIMRARALRAEQRLADLSPNLRAHWPCATRYTATSPDLTCTCGLQIVGHDPIGQFIRHLQSLPSVEPANSTGPGGAG